MSLHKNRSISIVSSQLQLVNMVEAIKKISFDNNIIIICSLSSKRDEQIKNLLSKQAYSGIFNKQYNFVFNENSFISLFQNIYFRIFVFILTIVNRFDACLFSHYWYPNHRYLAYRTELKNPEIRLVLVDDGTGIISFYKDRKELEIPKIKPATRLKTKFYSVVYFLSGLHKHMPNQLTVFTVYEIEATKTDIIIKNNYTYLKNNLATLIDSELLLDNSQIILGQPFAEIGIMLRSTYENYLKKIIDSNAHRKLYYIPHPAENVELLQKDISSKLHIIRLNLPVELFCISQNNTVSIIGFNTSAIPNIRFLDPDRDICAIYINDDDIINISEGQRLQNVYDYFAEQNITIIRYEFDKL